MNLVPIAAFAGLVVIVVFAILLRRAAVSSRAAEAFSADWLSDFSLGRYRPMERLLAESDYDFLAAQPGFAPSIARKLRAQRRHIFSGYLKLLRQDFDRLYYVAKLLVLYSPEDRPDLARTLVRQRFEFHCAVAVVQWRLALHALGIGTVDVSRLLGAVDRLTEQIRQPVIAEASAVA